MINKAYVLKMSRYNAWQNKQIIDVVKVMDEEELRLKRGAFFDSILGTLNHLLWGDAIWMSRWSDQVATPDKSIAQSIEFTSTSENWVSERLSMDGCILNWAKDLTNVELQGDLNWFSGALQKEVTRKKELCVMHMFNHQAHQRGQVHAMLTAAGQDGATSDLFILPEDF